MRIPSLREPNVVYEVSKLELAIKVVIVSACILFFALVWLHAFGFAQSEAEHDLWVEETVSKIELWKQQERR